MFKKLKDKLAEEVKSSPQRIQQFAQAAQAAVTSASSSISDITNSDLFSIGDNDTPQNNPSRIQPSPSRQQNLFQDINTTQSSSDTMDYHDVDSMRQRRLSNSSLASDVSFRLPSYETPSMYHIQSDMEVSASEADDRGFSGGPATLDRVTKEQLYAAYKRTQERYTKYRTQYGDLARHYKLLERENSKARSVLVETQDKALRRISELKEQCSLEQSAKAHLEKALRIEIEEKNMKISTLNTKIQLLQSNMQMSEDENKNDHSKNQSGDNEVQLISLSNDGVSHEESSPEVVSLTNKIEKMEQLLNKYKESLKASKEKNSQYAIDLQKMSHEAENKNKQIEELVISKSKLDEQLITMKKQIQDLNNKNEELQNQVNTFDFNKTKEMSTLEIDLQKANEELTELRNKIDVFNKREEEYAISLAENKLSIHKELESKEAEIKSLKDSLDSSKKEIQSLKIVINDYKNNISVLEEEKNKLNRDCLELTALKTKFNDIETHLQELDKRNVSLEQYKTKADEEYKCLQLQLKQETAEKMAMIDRNTYLETRNSQLSEENTKKTAQISTLENDVQKLVSKINSNNVTETEHNKLTQEVNMWKEKCIKLESEIQEERIELVKLQAEIEKLLVNHEILQSQNAEFRATVANLTSENDKLVKEIQSFKPNLKKLACELTELRQVLATAAIEANVLVRSNREDMHCLTRVVNDLLSKSVQFLEKNDTTAANYKSLLVNYEKLQTELSLNNQKYLLLKQDFEKLRDENNNLKENLTKCESEKDAINEQLTDTCNLYEASLNETKLLKDRNEQLTRDLVELNNVTQSTQTSISDEKNALIDKINILEQDNHKSTVTIQDLQQNLSKLNENLQYLTDKQKDYIDNINNLTNENKQLQKTITELNESLQSQSESENDKAIEQIKLLENQKQKLVEKYNDIENAMKLLIKTNEEVNSINQSNETKISDMNSEILNKSKELEKLQKIQASLELEVAEHLLKSEELTKVENDKKDLILKVQKLEDVNKSLENKIEKLNSYQETANATIQSLNEDINSKCKEIETNLARIKELDESIRSLSEENIKLKSEATNFVSSIKKLESEIDEIKQSHTEIEIEKDRLSSIIENLEEKEKLKSSDNRETQTEEHKVEDQSIHEPTAMLENKWVLENKYSMMSNTASLNLGKNAQEDLFEKYNNLKISYDTMKDENRRLLSDIEGLQTYLTKISKENSVLNDKLREVIATSEQSLDNELLSSDVQDLKNNIQVNKEKINDLLRENSLLVEENLELKDQLQSQNYSKAKEINMPSDFNDKEVKHFKEKLDQMFQQNRELEKRNIDLEQINKSVNGNITQLQDKNDRLKLSNEKLERRLDEALVSLRHLHSLQENTELEYLRNILYEYLTGSGTHSITLAKVLSAIVKFDDSQTQMVMQKEKERQGFLKQLGLI